MIKLGDITIMLMNHFKVDENTTLNNFLKDLEDKKNSHYIILDTVPASFIDIRTIALKVSNLDEKLKNLKKKLSRANDNNLKFLIESGDRVVEVADEKYYDFMDAIDELLQSESTILDIPITQIKKHEVFALNIDDKISNARNLFLQKRINLLPIIDKLEIIGEVRPIDMLVGGLFDCNDNSKGDYYSKKRENILNLPIENLVNKRPILFNMSGTLRDLMQIMVNKKLPSLIVVDDDENLYSTISYGDIFKLFKEEIGSVNNYNIEYSKGKDLFADEFDLIKDYADKSMKKISNMSNYDNLKVSFKLIGEKDSGHQHKFIVKSLLSHGNKTIHSEKEIFTGTSDEINNDKRKIKWNIPQIAQEVFKNLENQVIEEKRRNS